MGLDMYLRASKYVSGYEHTRSDEEKALYRRLVADAGLLEIADPETPSAQIHITVAYWRKANQIHRWFVENVQEGEDECKAHYVGREQLEELRNLCIRAIAEKDGELLPGQEGFFFGGVEQDEWYWQGISDTVIQLDRVLKAPGDIDFEYQSSW